MTGIGEVQQIFGLTNEQAQEIGVEGMKMLTAIVKGITNPNKQSAEVKAIAGLLGKKTVSSITMKDLSEIFGIEVGASRQEKVNAILSKIKLVSEQGNGAEVELSMELTAVAGGLLLAMDAQKVDRMSMLNQGKINGNQKTITKLLRNEYKTNFANTNNDFVIDIDKLQKSVKEKVSYSAQERKNILDALAMDSSKWKKDEKAIAGLFKLQNIHAIAASA